MRALKGCTLCEMIPILDVLEVDTPLRMGETARLGAGVAISHP